MNPFNQLLEDCKRIDSLVSSGALLYDDECLEMLKSYIRRWTHSIDIDQAFKDLDKKYAAGRPTIIPRSAFKRDPSVDRAIRNIELWPDFPIDSVILEHCIMHNDIPPTAPESAG